MFRCFYPTYRDFTASSCDYRHPRESLIVPLIIRPYCIEQKMCNAATLPERCTNCKLARLTRARGGVREVPGGPPSGTDLWARVLRSVKVGRTSGKRSELWNARCECVCAFFSDPPPQNSLPDFRGIGRSSMLKGSGDAPMFYLNKREVQARWSSWPPTNICKKGMRTKPRQRMVAKTANDCCWWDHGNLTLPKTCSYT